MRLIGQAIKRASLSTIPLMVSLGAVAAGCTASEDFTTSSVEIELQGFIVAVRAGDVRDIVVNGPEITFEWNDEESSVTYKTMMEPGNTFEQVLLAQAWSETNSQHLRRSETLRAEAR
jgi:hypothetical protein